MGVRFQYARKLYECDECNGKIRVGALVSYYYKRWYHYDCFLKQRYVDVYKFQKSEIMIWLERSSINNGRRTVSLEEFDKHPHRFQLEITLADLTKIREQFALAKERKTESFIPWASKTANLNCHGCARPNLSFIPWASKTANLYYHGCARPNSVVGGEQLGLYFQGDNYHPKCLIKTRKVNVDAKEIRDYDSLSKDDKKHLDKLFKKDDDAFFLPCCIPFDGEYCSLLNCREEEYGNNDTRIRYKTKTYHLECFAKMRKVNMDGEEFENYDTLSDSQKLRLQKLKKSDDFDIPLIEKAKTHDYCTSADCRAANGQPSKFPWPYTIKPTELQIKFLGDIYHSRCFKSSQIVNMDVKQFLGYESLSLRTKQMLEENLEDIEMDTEEGESSGDDSDSSDSESDQMDDDNNIDGPPAKKSKMEPQMQDENVSEENIQNEFDNDQEPFDGTNVKEEMSEPIVLQMNTLIESYNAEVGPQIVNNREEREENQESGDCAAEEVDDKDIKEIPEIKTEVNGEPEIVTLDDEVEINEVQSEIKQESVAESYHFDVPSGAFFRSTLGKFDIELSNEVYKFYGEFKYTKIPTTASPGTTFPISSCTDSFFKCLSLYLTGKEEHFSVIKMGIQAYFFNNSKTFGIIDGIDFSNLNKSSPEFCKFHECVDLTNAHFTLISSWFNCRFMIFSSGRLSGKYGNWNGNDDPIFLIENDKGLYKPVLSLN